MPLPVRGRPSALTLLVTLLLAVTASPAAAHPPCRSHTHHAHHRRCAHPHTTDRHQSRSHRASRPRSEHAAAATTRSWFTRILSAVKTILAKLPRQATTSRPGPAVTAPAAHKGSPSPVTGFPGGAASPTSAPAPNGTPPDGSPGCSGAGPTISPAAVEGALCLFSATSVWNATVPTSASLDPQSQSRVAGLLAEEQKEHSGGYGPWVNTTQYSTPLYTVGAGQSLVPVTLPAGASGLQTALSAGVPVPADAQPAGGSDSEISIYQRSTDTLWEFWQMNHQSDGWHASWGGVMHHASQSPGYYTDQSVPGLAADQGWNWGATATSLPPIAGTIMPGEVLAGAVNHALAMAIPNPCGGWWSWPAQRTDGGSQAANCMPEGAHLRIDPSVDLSRLGLPPLTLLLARAAQRYGIVVRDQAPEVEFFGLDTSHNGSDGGAFATPPWDYMPQFPWADLQLLQAPHCTSEPCLPAAAQAEIARQAPGRRGSRRLSSATHRRTRHRAAQPSRRRRKGGPSSR